MDFLSKEKGKRCFILASDKNKKDQKNLRGKLKQVDYCPKQDESQVTFSGVKMTPDIEELK